MKPSEVRDYIGRQHIQLRILFVEVEHACRESTDVRRMILKLVREVEDHLTLEDRLLVPALREIDCWGTIRAERVSADHAAQRLRLAELRRLAKHALAADAAQAAMRLIGDLITDMDAEETDLLGPNLLSDDPIVINQIDG